MQKLILYTGTDCHLCDIAKSMLAQGSHLLSWELAQINVKEQREYFHQYGARIPVLQRVDNQSELGWPFDIKQLGDFLS